MVLISFMAGIVALLSPCILPLLPILAASSADRKTPALAVFAGGFLLSFAVLQVGLIVLRPLYFLDIEWTRRVGALLMIFMGLLMFFPPSTFLSRLIKSPRAAKSDSLRRPFLEGLSLGMIWSPCLGPALGATLGLLATRGRQFSGSIGIIAFGLGATLPLLLLGMGFSQVLRWLNPARQRRLRRIHQLSAWAFVLVGTLVITGWDRRMEGWITQRMPEGWVEWLANF